MHSNHEKTHTHTHTHTHTRASLHKSRASTAHIHVDDQRFNAGRCHVLAREAKIQELDLVRMNEAGKARRQIEHRLPCGRARQLPLVHIVHSPSFPLVGLAHPPRPHHPPPLCPRDLCPPKQLRLGIDHIIQFHVVGKYCCRGHWTATELVWLFFFDFLGVARTCQSEERSVTQLQTLHTAH
jgi:hypothetical protein